MGGCFQSSYAKHESTVTLGDFSIIKQSKLAEGAYGDVWKCKSSHDDCIYALKEIKLQNKELKDMYEKEARILVNASSYRSNYEKRELQDQLDF
jgi:serine/threonine protein kinase